KQEILDTLKAKGVDLPEGFVIEDAFLDAIIKAHEIAGGEGEGLGSFSLGTLLNKRKALDAYLSTTSLNPEQQSAIARCLMEGGFCGKGIASILYYMIKGRSEYQDPNAGLPFEQRRAIAQQQLEQNGITDEQRSAYMPGLSEELYNNIDPSGYEIVDKIWDFFDPSEKQELDEMIKQHSDVYDNSKRKDARALYLGLPQRHNTFKTSEYKPSKAKENKTYFALQDEVRIFNQYKEAIDAFEEYKQALASGQTIKDLKADQKQRAKERKRDGAFDIREELIYAREQTLLNAYEQYEKQGTIVLQDFEIGKENVVTGDIEQKFDKGVMGQYTISTGIDPENGLHYMSYYDIWDLHPFTGPLKRLGDRLPGKPFEIYGRIYYNPQTMQIIDPDMYQSSTHNDRIDSQP
ncbi:MAG: hypothetical protein WC004_05295, partial [Candidatus Absconditabacterales bacterium]